MTRNLWRLFMGRQSPAEFLALTDDEIGRGIWPHRLAAVRAVVEAKVCDEDGDPDEPPPIRLKGIALALLGHAETTVNARQPEAETR